MHGTFKKKKDVEATAPQPQKADTPDYIGPDWWLHKAMYDPNGDQVLKQMFSPPQQ
jgi:hypothetical protein